MNDYIWALFNLFSHIFNPAPTPFDTTGGVPLSLITHPAAVLAIHTVSHVMRG